MAALHELNEKSESKLIGPIAGSSFVSSQNRITVAESITLKHYGIDTCASLFKKAELTNSIDILKDTEYAAALTQRHGRLVDKCKQLRSALASRQLNKSSITVSLHHLFVGTKTSQLYRKMKRNEINRSIKIPPSYRTRKRDKYALPPVEKYMLGYTRLFSMNIPSKTREISFNILNRQSWSNQKQFWVNKNRGIDLEDEGASNGKCKLCGKVETTQHLILECEEYAEGVWENVGRLGSEVFKENIVIHCFDVMYNQPVRKIPSKYIDTVDAIIQEIKRFIIQKRYMRETNTNLANIIYNEIRINAHILIIISKIRSLRRYQGLKNNEALDQFVDNIRKRL